MVCIRVKGGDCMKKHENDSINVGCIERLRKNLRSFSDTNTKEPKNWYERYRETMRNVRYRLADSICDMNGIDPESIGRNVDIFGVVTIKNKNGVFFNRSKIRWSKNDKDRKTLITDKKEMRIRFLTYLYIVINERLDDIIDSLTANKPNASYKYDCEVLKDFERLLDMLSSALFHNDEYGNILLRLATKIEYLVQGVNHRKFNKRLVNVIFDLRDGLTKRPLLDAVSNIGVKIPDDLAIDGIIKVAFMLRTGVNKFSALPRFDDIENVTLDYDLSQIIARLGKAVKQYESSILYDAWVNSEFNASDKRDDLSEGTKSLQFTQFILNNKDISSFINNMLEF